MTLKIFYDKTTWRGFFPPEKPERPTDTFCMTFYMIDMRNYDEAYAEAKANALEVGNPELFSVMRGDRPYVNRYVQPLASVPLLHREGAEYTWYGSAVIKDGKYILSI